MDVTVKTTLAILVVLIITTAILLGNFITIVAFIKTPHLNTASNFFIIALAISDLVVGFSIPYDMVVHLMLSHDKVKEDYSQFAIICLGSVVPIIVSLIASSINIFLIAFDRYTSVAYPVFHRNFMTRRHAKILIALGVLLALLIGSVPLYSNNWPGNRNGKTFCTTLVISFNYFLAGPLAVVLCCDGLMIFMYIKIHKIASSHMPENSKPLKLVVIVLTCCLICWAPFMTCLFFATYEAQPSVKEKLVGISHGVYILSLVICFCNSFMNPIIYTWKMPDFREAALKILCLNTRDDQIRTTTAKEHTESSL
ncbi:D(1C) dopamine receptor-like [Neocloeon triangulifer]|uniref:D(1C) dopamine receptor-like n=1 Tax=Neocloeon triangulifer TaxID=2078957 RepID=UPI00286F37B6|nr:D(1C) dopamine receptor-like [Neocloeon triangulifer]